MDNWPTSLGDIYIYIQNLKIPRCHLLQSHLRTTSSPLRTTMIAALDDHRVVGAGGG